VFRGAKGLEVHGSTVLKGKVSFQRAVLQAKATTASVLRVTVPLTATYAVVSAVTRAGAEDAKNGAVEVRFDTAGADTVAPTAGRVLLLTNLDELTTTGDAAVPPQSTVMMLFDGQRWVSVDALKAPMHVSL
jgi:hypothetical protein